MFDAPMLPVEVNDVVIKRTSEPDVLLYDRNGRPAVVHMRPQLLYGEVLVERLDKIPMIEKGKPWTTES